MFCGEDAASWYDSSVKIGLNPSMLPPYGQSKLHNYAGVPPNGQTICANCIDTIDAKMAEKPKSRTISPSFSVDTASNSTVTYTAPCPVIHTGTQQRCTGGDQCRYDAGAFLSTNPDHRCLVCSLFMHPQLHMCGMRYVSWLSKTCTKHSLEISVVRNLLSPDSLKRVENSVPHDTGICATCVTVLDSKIAWLGTATTAEDDGGDIAKISEVPPPPVQEASESTTTRKPEDWTKEEWDKFVDSIPSWRSIIVSVQPVNRCGRSKTELSQLESITVGSMVVTPFQIQPDVLRKVCTKVGYKVVVPKGMKKPTKQMLCNGLVEYRGAQENLPASAFGNAAAAASGGGDGAIATATKSVGGKSKKPKVFINVQRLLNVIFSAEYKPKFEERGKSLTRKELENKDRVDQDIWVDVFVAYLDSDCNHYGKHAFDSLAMAKDPSKFQQVGIGVNDWAKFQKRFNALMGEYEKKIQASKVSGYHGDPLQDCKNDELLYLHAYMSIPANDGMYSSCCALLPLSVFCDSAEKNKTDSSTSNHRKKQGITTEGSKNLVSSLTARNHSSVEKYRRRQPCSTWMVKLKL